MSKLFDEAYDGAATVRTAESAFRASEIWPVNCHIFTDYQFASLGVLLPSGFRVAT